MATNYYNVEMGVVDASGNLNVIYPVTTANNVAVGTNETLASRLNTINSNKANKIDYTSNVTVSGGINGAQNIIKMSVTISGLTLSNLTNKVLMIITGSENSPFSALTFGIFSRIGGASGDIAYFTTICGNNTCVSSDTATLSNSFSIKFNFASNIASYGSAYNMLKKFLVF